MAQPAVNKVTVFSIANPKHAIALLRIIAPLSEADIEIIWCMPDQEYHVGLISSSDLVIIQRDFPRLIEYYIQVHLDAHRLGIPLIFEIDDLLWELPEEHPDRANHHYADALLPMMFAAWTADGITVSSPGIKDYLSWLNPNVYVLPNYLDPKLWSFREPEPKSGRMISIGYMGGDSHLPDLGMIETVILNILERYQGRVNFITWGLQVPLELKNHPLVVSNLLTPGDYAAFAKYFNQQDFDIYIAPLKDSLFNRCKSSIKVLEYTALGITGVSSNVEPYSSVFQDGFTGLLAETSEQWENHLKMLIDQPDLRLQIARQAMNFVRREWLLSENFNQWLETYANILGSFTSKKDVPQKLHLLDSISAQIVARKQQLSKNIDDQNKSIESRLAEIFHLEKLRSQKVVQVLRSKFNRLFTPEQEQPNLEIHDE